MDFTKDSTSYLVTLGDGDGKADASVVCGGKLSKTVPNINASKWDDEAFLNLNPTWLSVLESSVVQYENGVVSVQSGDVKWVSYITNRNRLENGFYFASKPAYKKIELEMQCRGLDFYPQGKLTGPGYRPDEVIGSIAVYYNKKNNKYKSGKFAHIYPPYFMDANGSKIKLTQYIENDKLIIDFDDAYEWLDKAMYPVFLGPELGWTGDGASNWDTTYIAVTTKATTDGSGGVVTNFHAYIDTLGLDSSFTGTVYDVSGVVPDDLYVLTNSKPINHDGSIEVTQNSFAQNDTLAASTDYGIGIMFASFAYVRFDSATGNNTYYDPVTTTWPDPWSTSGYIEREMSVWVDYASGAAPSVPKRRPSVTITISSLAPAWLFGGILRNRNLSRRDWFKPWEWLKNDHN